MWKVINLPFLRYNVGMKRIAAIIWQFTWGIIQSLCGLVLFVLNFNRKHYWYRNAVVTEWHHEGSVSLGLFLFVEVSRRSLGKSFRDIGEERTTRYIIMHEYGHSLQSMILGPLYMFIVGIPSLIWCNVPYFNRFRKDRKMSYYAFYTEKWANRLSYDVTGEEVKLR